MVKKKQMEQIERFIAKKIMGFYPQEQYGQYTFSVGEISGTVEFMPMVKKEHAFMLLDKLSELGYDYSIQCHGNRQSYEHHALFEQKGFTMSLRNRNNVKEPTVLVENDSLYTCIIEGALKAAQEVE